MIGRGIDQVFDAREKESVLMEEFVKIFVIYANASLPVRLFHHHDVGYLLGYLVSRIEFVKKNVHLSF